MHSLKHKKVVITGASQGLGLGLIKEALKRGAKVVAIARHSEKLSESLGHTSAILIPADISSKNTTYPLAAQINGQLGAPDLIINNASYLGPSPLRRLLDTECEDFTKVLETNLIGPFRFLKALLPGLVNRGSGAVINISSDAAVSPYPEWGAYSVSKAALDHLTRIWHQELHEQGIDFLALDPGDMATQMHFDAIPDATPKNLYPPEVAAREILDFFVQQSWKGAAQQRWGAEEWRKNL